MTYFKAVSLIAESENETQVIPRCSKWHRIVTFHRIIPCKHLLLWQFAISLLPNLFYVCVKTLKYFCIDSLWSSTVCTAAVFLRVMCVPLPISRKRIDTIAGVGGVCRGRTQCCTYSLVKRAAQGSCCNFINTVLETACLERQRLASHKGALKQL